MLIIHSSFANRASVILYLLIIKSDYSVDNDYPMNNRDCSIINIIRLINNRFDGQR